MKEGTDEIVLTDWCFWLLLHCNNKAGTRGSVHRFQENFLRLFIDKSGL